ncbi:nucleoside triphosphate pyrophosphohydrolase family protein [Phascolarctobacterium sp.]|uniref:nucleoside triphosphate pyrophosphohydrolase family protein n=1 Tax=Phascolarctobacterium sp. TaxID=2049039 RepID=UPI003864D570
MTGKKYVELAMRTNDGKCTERLTNAVKHNVLDMGGIFYASLGLCGEAGELNDMIKKWVFHEKPLDEEHAKKELGDIMWYIAMMCHSFGWDLDEIMRLNIIKLMARYPEGFSVERANNRAAEDV